MTNLCLFACSEQFQLEEGALTFVDVIQDLGQQLGIKLTHIDYSSTEYQESDDLPNDTPFGPDSLGQLKTLLDQTTISDLALWSSRIELDDQTNFDLYSELVVARLVQGYKYAYIQFPQRYANNPISDGLFAFFHRVLLSLNRIGRLDYALVTTMEDALLPLAYFRGIYTPGLSSEEALSLATWERKFTERKTRLRGLYWGNLLSAEHLARITDYGVFLNRLHALVGSQRLETVNGDDLFFMLPSSNVTSDPVAYKVKTLLGEHDLLMVPDDEARRTLSRLVTR